VVLVKATASSSCKLQQLQMHGCGIADMGFIQGAIKLRAEEALANAKGPKKKAKKKKKGGKAKEEPAGEPLSRQHICPIDPCPRSVAQTDLRFECNKSKSMHQICSSIWAVTPADEHNFMSMGLHTLNSGGCFQKGSNAKRKWIEGYKWATLLPKQMSCNPMLLNRCDSMLLDLIELRIYH